VQSADPIRLDDGAAGAPVKPRPWREAPALTLQACHGVLTDIDDTLTRDGAIEPQALQALHALDQAGIPVVAITGRPVGWSEPFALAWPVRAIVAENGAVMLTRAADGRLQRSFVQDAATRAKHTERLQHATQRILQEVPSAVMASDSAGRLTDIAVDHSEHVQLPAAAIDAVVRIMQSEGMTATVSSIHINGWFGTHNKWTGACWAVQSLFDRALPDEVAQWLYIGDSTNDQVMFAQCPNAVGVANLMRFAGSLTAWPRYITEGERGQGVAEVARALLAARERS
jgi:HAD superfamily hydrolase (TIGR01484 family)